MTDDADKRVRSRATEKRVTRTDIAARNQKNQEVVRQFAWTVSSIDFYLQEIRYFWAKALGISGPQWMILMALADIDQDDGVPVNVVSKKLHVDSSFVTTQSKLLEKKGFIRRKN